MKEFVLNGDIVKRLLYNKPIINEDYTHNNIEYDFTSWDFNNNQPSEGITISKGKIIITKFKPNEPIIISNFTGDAANGSPTIQNICSISKELKINLKGVSANNDIFGADKAYNNNNILANGTIGYIYGLGFLPYKTTYREGRPLEKWGEMPFSCYVWGNITLEDNSTVQIASETTYLRSDIQGAYNRYGKINNYTNKQIFPNWKSWYGREEGAWYDTDFQLSIGLYTNVSPDENGFIELSTPVEISLIDNSVVDPTTQEAFKLYNKNELIYERDKNVNNLYKVFNLLKDNTQTYKSSWQKQKEDNDGETFDENVAYVFTKEDYDYQKISLPVAIDLVQKIQEFVPFKFNITQYDSGRNEFWKTVIQTINNISAITDYAFCWQLFKNAKGLSDLDWDTIGDNALHGIVINIGQGTTYFVIDEAFAYSDIPAVTINNAGGTLRTIHDVFKYSDIKHIKFDGIILHDIVGAFEGTSKLQSIEGLNIIGVLSTFNGGYLSEDTTPIHYSFEGSSLETLNIDGGDIIVYPYCPQVFGSNCKLKTITGSAFDFKFVNPDDIVNWGVGSWYGHPIFGNSILESIKIKNLNKGNWTIPMPLNNTSVNYLLNNIYDLTTNDGTNLEKDSNSFNSWSANNVNIWSSKNAAFEKNKSNCSISKSSFTGEKILKLKATEQTSFNIELINSGNSVYNNSVIININETVIDFSTYTFDTIIISKDMSNINNNIGLELTDPFDSAASNVTSATLTFTQIQYNSEFDAAIAVAQQRGWTIQFAS